MIKIDKLYANWGKTIMLALCILALAFFLRLLNIKNGQTPIFGDEAIYIRWAQIMRADPTLRFVSLSDGKQPLYMWALMPFLKVYSDPLFAGRLVSVFCGLGTILGVLLLTQYLFQAKKVTLIAGLIYTLSPFSLFFDSMALVDAMLAMFGVWTVFLATAAIKTRRLDFAMLAGFALGGALLTKSPGIYFALLLPSVILLWQETQTQTEFSKDTFPP